MTQVLKLVAVLAAVAGSATGCATTETASVAGATPAATECAQSTGSSICRKPGAADTSGVRSVSGDDFRSAGQRPAQQ